MRRGISILSRAKRRQVVLWELVDSRLEVEVVVMESSVMLDHDKMGSRGSQCPCCALDNRFK